MSPATRIILNAVATYGQSLIRLLIGLFSMRWVLAALGQEDFGLYCVVGSLITFIVFINSVLGGSNARFYAYSIGSGKKMVPEDAADDLKRWFNTALSIHTVIPTILMLIGYPIAEYAIRHWINIPDGRVVSCVWVFRIACVSAFVNMSSVPFLSMYTAKQYIAVRAGFGIAATIMNFAGALSLLYVPCDKLIAYAFYMMLINAGLPLLQIGLAIRCFPECRLHLPYWRDGKRLKELLSYAGWIAFGGGGGSLIGNQGGVFVTNHYFGAAINSSYGIALQLSAQAQTLSAALTEALAPAVTTSQGSDNREATQKLVYRTGKFGVFLMLVFAIPMVLEMRMLLTLWLGRIPDFVVPICTFFLLASAIEKFTLGHQMAIAAAGKVALWQFIGGILNVLVFPVAWLLAFSGVGAISSAVAAFLCPCCTFVGNLLFARHLVGMPIKDWLKTVFVPMLGIAILTVAIGMLPKCFLPSCWWRIGVTASVCLVVLIFLGWGFLLSAEEKSYILEKLRRLNKSRN